MSQTTGTGVLAAVGATAGVAALAAIWTTRAYQKPLAVQVRRPCKQFTAAIGCMGVVLALDCGPAGWEGWQAPCMA